MGIMICLAGLPGSGKTTWAMNYLVDHPNILYFSPDAYYERINGDECNRTNAFEVWMAMFRDIHIAEQNGQSVLIDSDNLTYAQRNQWIEWFPDFDQHLLFFFEEPFEDCYNRMLQRRRTIPEEVMEKKYLKWQSPLDKEKTQDYLEWDMILQIPYKENIYESFE